MSRGITSRLPAAMVNAIFQAVHLGTAYACLSLLSACVGKLFNKPTPLGLGS